MTHIDRGGTVDVDAIALGIVKVFPVLDRFEQRLSLELYRLLSRGQPVARVVLAERLQASVEMVDHILDGWPGVFSDSERRISGYWGLSIAAAYRSPHHVSFLMPAAADAAKDIVSTFCHFVHFFPSQAAGEAWAAQHPGTFILSVAQAHAVARRKNQAEYGEVTGSKVTSVPTVRHPPDGIPVFPLP